MKAKDRDEPVNPGKAAESENEAKQRPPEDRNTHPGEAESAPELAGDVTTPDTP